MSDTTLVCPVCTDTRARMVNEAAYRWNYLCQTCDHAWSVSKRDPTDIKHITPLPPTDLPKDSES